MNTTSSKQKYAGIHNDIHGGMTDTGKVIRDAWVFEIIPETETCEGWLATDIQSLWDQTSVEWEKYGYLVGNLPKELRERFDRIQGAAMKRAKESDWNPDQRINEYT